MKYIDPIFPVPGGVNLIIALIFTLPLPLRIAFTAGLLVLLLLGSFLWMRHNFTQVPNTPSGPNLKMRTSRKGKGKGKGKKHHREHKHHEE